MSGIGTPNLPASPDIDDVIGNSDGNTVRVGIARLAAIVATLQGPSYQSRAQLYADLDWAAGSMGSVWGDAAEANKGVYRKSGAAGTGSWVRVGDLPVSAVTGAQLATKADQTALNQEISQRIAAIRDAGVMSLKNVGGKNAITAELTSGLAAGGATISGSSTVELIPAETSDGPVTLNIDGGGAIPVRDAAGNEVQVGALVAGRSYFLRRRGSTWRVIVGGVTSVELRAEVSERQAAIATEVQMRANATRETGVLPLTNVVGINSITASLTVASGVAETGWNSIVELIPASTNTGPVTLNVGGAGAWPIQRRHGSDLLPGDLRASQSYLLRRRDSVWRMVGSVDSESQAKFDAEAQARGQAVDVERQSRVNALAAEAQARGQAVDAERQARVNALAAEAAGRKAADEAETAARLVEQSALRADISVVVGELADPLRRDALLPMHRPGDSPWLHAISFTGGDPYAAHPSPKTAISAEGRVARLTGAEIVSARCFYALEPGRQYQARFAVTRVEASADPAGDAITCGVAFYDRATGLIGTATVAHLLDLTPTSGRREVVATISRAPGAEVTAPAGAVYARPYTRTYGASGVTDVEVIEWTDATGRAVWAPDVQAFASRLTALEGFDIAARLTDLEVEGGTASTVRYPSRGAAVAARIRASADVIDVPGLGAYRRDPFGTALITADGASWSPIGVPTPEHFGAVGDGVADDTTAVLAWAGQSGRIRATDGAIYSIKKSITVRARRVDADGARFVWGGGGRAEHVHCNQSRNPLGGWRN